MHSQECKQSRECEQCRGSGACDPCDGYGFYPDSSPNAGDGPECEYCAGSGDCPDCHGTGQDNQISYESEQVNTP